jgi:uncharacterized membrane protein YcjF (UPF0283 family)
MASLEYCRIRVGSAFTVMRGSGQAKNDVKIIYIMMLIIAIIIGLVFWALQLMEQAYQRQEFSRMLAGTLVAVAAAGVLTTYFLMSDYIAYLSQNQSPVSQLESIVWLAEETS